MTDLVSRGPLLAINHLLSAEDWARARLVSFAGDHVCTKIGPFTFAFVIGNDGYIAAANLDDASPDVTISLSPSLPELMLGSPTQLMDKARISGKAALAETLGLVFRNLRWDYESDLARLVGDIPARRLARIGEHCVTAHQEFVKRGVANATEYLIDEAHLLVDAMAIKTFGADVDVLRNDVERLERRIALLSRSAPSP